MPSCHRGARPAEGACLHWLRAGYLIETLAYHADPGCLRTNSERVLQLRNQRLEAALARQTHSPEYSRVVPGPIRGTLTASFWTQQWGWRVGQPMSD